MTVIRSVREMQAWADQARTECRRIGFVPTMGYLHEGHLSLVRVARAESDVVVASIFVNPLQFGPSEDLARYPRDFARDQAMLAREGCAVIFSPEAGEMYPKGFLTTVQVAQMSEGLCGQSRPGHFQGVVTVVAKLFNAVKPHVAVFGAKDAQQALVIQRMTRDLDFDIEVVVAPTIREPDGLAMSSRNTYLNPEERRQAPVLYKALQLGAEMIANGEPDAGRVVQTITDVIAASRGRIDYVSIVDAETLAEVKEIRGRVLIALAVFFGRTRLIDNISVAPELPSKLRKVAAEVIEGI
jgi:pantoate--beta-alanine ligase